MVTTVLQQSCFALQTQGRSESLSNLVAKSTNVPLIISSIFPLYLFQDILIIDENADQLPGNTEKLTLKFVGLVEGVENK